MNILHMKYAAEVAKVGSLSKAADTLLIAQPNISRSIKELEADLGITIFQRSSKGMNLTPEGEEFIGYANGILAQIEQVERLYKREDAKKQTFSVSVPGTCYIAEAFAAFSGQLDQSAAEIFYKESESRETIRQVVNRQYQLGVIRYAVQFDPYFKTMLEEKGLCYELVAEFSHVVLMNRQHALAECSELYSRDLVPYTEIVHADPYAPAFPLAKTPKEEGAERRIFSMERAEQLDLLSQNAEMFMWVAPVSETVLERYGLIQRPCMDHTAVYKDVLIYREGYKFSALDKQFITALCRAKRNCLS